MAAGSDPGARPKLLTLSEAYSRHEAALRASLRAEYQIRDIRTESVRDLPGLVAWLPDGCALWRSMGGPKAWSAETAMLHRVEYRLCILAWQKTESGSKGLNQPVPPTPPPYAGEAERSDREMSKRAEAWQRRQARQASQ